MNNNYIKLSIWDAAGHERYSTIIKDFLQRKRMDLVIISVDVTSNFSLLRLSDWLEVVKDIKMKILIGTKCDIEKSKWIVTHDQLREIAKKNRCIYIPTSSKLDKNIDIVFNLAAFMGAYDVFDEKILLLNQDTSIDF